MVIVDSSVWIDTIRGRETAETSVFDRIVSTEEIGLGDLILYEVLQGISPPERFEKVRSHLLTFPIFVMGGRDIAMEAVAYARLMRRQGIQVRTVDCLIGTFCITTGNQLLSSDRHFEPFERLLGLVMAR